MNYQKLAKEIMSYIGTDNVEETRHCATRLRLRVINPNNVDTGSIQDLPGVQKVVSRGNDLQIVIGNEVYEVYDEFVKLVDPCSSEELSVKEKLISDNEPDNSNQKNAKENVFLTFVNTISECISPILPALIAAGLSSALASLIRATGWMDLESTTYQLISFFGAAPMYFLPFFLALGAATRLKVNPYVSMSVAALVLYPNLTELIAGKADFFGISVMNVTYSQSLIPILLVVWLQTYIEPVLTKVIHTSVRTMLLPFTEFLILGVLTLLVLGPIGGLLTKGIAAILTPLSENYAWLVVAILGSLFVFLVGTGLHHGILPIAVTNLTMFGYDNIIGPAMFVTTFALAGTSFGYAIKTKNNKMKQVAVSSGVSSLMGITEPGIYGLLFVNKKSLISCMITGLIGGLFMGILGVRVWALGPKGITGFALLAGPEFLLGAAGCVITFIIGFIVSYSLGEDKSLSEIK